jgi:hypothetical protein
MCKVTGEITWLHFNAGQYDNICDRFLWETRDCVIPCSSGTRAARKARRRNGHHGLNDVLSLKDVPYGNLIY